MELLNDWEEEEIIHRNEIINFEFLNKKGYVIEISEGFYYLSEEHRVVETELWKNINDELANELDIKDIDKEIKRFIGLLNKYNEIKDIGQELIGRIADLRQTTTKSVHEELGMELE